VTPRLRVLILGTSWLVWIWLLAAVASRATPWLAKGHGWPCDVIRRVIPLARWDSGWYVSLAERGYSRRPAKTGEETDHAFFPLYPGLTRLASNALGIETSRAGGLLSAAAFLVALVLFAEWTAAHFGPARSLPSVAVLLAFPTSFFFAAVYTESLLLALALAAVLAAERNHPLTAAAAGLLSGLTRISGIVLAPYLFVCSLRKSRAQGSPPLRALAQATFVGLSPLAGFGLFCLYFWRKFGDPLLFVRAQNNWSAKPKTVLDGPFLLWDTIVEDIGTGRVFTHGFGRTLEGIFFIIFAYLAMRLVVEKKPLEALYVAATIGIVPVSGTFESMGRYVLPAFPAFVALGTVANRRALFGLYLAASFLVQVGYVWAFVNWYWTG
jgi:Mannosyltransferase (PIG-V)